MLGVLRSVATCKGRNGLSNTQKLRGLLFIHMIPTPTPNRDALKFSISDSRYTFPAAEQIVGKRQDDFVKEISALKGVKGVFVRPDFLTVTKDGASDWSDLTETILAILENLPTEQLTPVEAFKDQQDPAKGRDTDDDVIADIQALIEEKVRPYVQGDGGDCQFVRYDKDKKIVFLSMLGACTSCASSTVTLKFMVKNLLLHYLGPEVVQDVERVDEEDVCNMKMSEERKKAF